MTSTHGFGVMVVIHDPFTYPRIEEQAFSIEPGVEAYVTVEQITRKDLNPPYSAVRCHRDGEYQGFFFDMTSCYTVPPTISIYESLEGLGNRMLICMQLRLYYEMVSFNPFRGFKSQCHDARYFVFGMLDIGRLIRDVGGFNMQWSEFFVYSF